MREVMKIFISATGFDIYFDAISQLIKMYHYIYKMKQMKLQ